MYYYAEINLDTNAVFSVGCFPAAFDTGEYPQMILLESYASYLVQHYYFTGYDDDGKPVFEQRLPDVPDPVEQELISTNEITEDVLLEIAADHEYRISLIEMGVFESDL